MLPATCTMEHQRPFYGGKNADTRNLHDVYHSTHIIDILGVCDIGHQPRASPTNEGWMVSDFYPWIAVLEGMGKSQVWLTWENPHALLENYGSQAVNPESITHRGERAQERLSCKGGYINGDPFVERLVVLSQNNVGK